MSGPVATLDAVLPAPHFRERHARRIAAPPEAVWRALFAVRLSDSPLAAGLMALRMLPARLAGRRRPEMDASAGLQGGPVPVLAVEPGRSVVAGGVLQPWRPLGGDESPELSAAALSAFAEPGWAVCAVDIVLEPDGGGTLLRTETRVRATDRATRIRFGFYWLAIRAGSGLIRRELLRLVARRAEAPS